MKITYYIIIAITTSLLWGCTNTDDPSNLEPVITLLDATGITRTEATIAARIEKRGTTDLSYVQFMYSDDTGKETVSDKITPTGDIISMTLTGLKPGTTYTYRVTGGTTTASIKSRSLSFTTIPNERPKISEARPLSTGPIGIIVEFEIYEDGGEPLLDAGCKVLERSTGNVTDVHITDKPIQAGKYRLPIGSLSVLTEYEITSYAVNKIGETTSEPLVYTTRNSAILTEAGTLSQIFSDNRINLTSIVISGPMNGDDFLFLRRILNAQVEGGTALESDVTDVDITDADIVEGGGPYDGTRYTENGIISTGLLGDCADLKKIALPSSATVIMKDALINCTRLLSLTVPANVNLMLPSTGCTALEYIDVSEANSSYKSVDGVLFNNDITSILWFPTAKTGAYTLPSTITKIARNAFSDTHITSLIIPTSVKDIERGAFSGSILEDIVLPDNITNISEGMFQNCSYLKEIQLGTNVDFIGNYAFDGCPLENIYIKADNPPYATNNAFTNHLYDLYNTCTLRVPSTSISRYRNHSQWGKFNKITTND